jgi:hypothetical protein
MSASEKTTVATEKMTIATQKPKSRNTMKSVDVSISRDSSNSIMPAIDENQQL